MNLVIEVGMGLAFVFALVAIISSGLQEFLSAILNLRGKTLWEGVQSMLQANAPANAKAVASGDVPDPKKADSAEAAAAVSGANPQALAPTSKDEAHLPVQVSPGVLLEAAMRAHPLITGLVPDRFGPLGLVQWMRGTRRPGADIGSAKPSYLQASTFATVLADKIGECWNGGRRGFDDFALAVGVMPDCALKTILRGMIRDTQGDPAKLRVAIEAWYDETMERVTGWYKRRMQLMLMVIGLLVAGLMNIDAIHLTSALSTQPGLREAIADKAATAARNVPEEDKTAPDKAANDQKKATQASEKLRDLNLPIGWVGGRPIMGFGDGCLMIAGWLITALAASLGAPFWFDLINKLVPLRSAGVKPPEAPKPPLSNTATRTRGYGVSREIGTSNALREEPFRAALNDYEAYSISADEIIQIKRTLGVRNANAETPALDQETRDAIQKKQQEMEWPASGQLSAQWVDMLRTGGI